MSIDRLNIQGTKEVEYSRRLQVRSFDVREYKLRELQDMSNK